MKKLEIREQLKDIAQHTDKENFIFDFLRAFDISKTTISRLKKGDYNHADADGEVFYRKKIYFKPERTGNLYHSIDELGKQKNVQKYQPRFLFVTDFNNVVARDTKRNANIEFELRELAEQVNFFLPLSGAEIYRVQGDTKADRDAAYQMGELYELLIADNPDWIKKGSHHLNLFLSRLLFCFFAEDTGIFPKEDLFTEALGNDTRADGKDVDEFLDELFKKLNTRETQSFSRDIQAFPYVNGGLFRDEIHCPKFSPKTRRILIESGELDWSEINPDIFGSMIQAVADPEERNNLGMHYTSVENILKVIKPLFLDELYAEYEKQKERENPKGLKRLLTRMGNIKFFDPACGSGNFLIITYKEIRLLEIRIIKQFIALTKQQELYFTEISLDQFYGIEIKDFAHEMSILSLWLAQHQMNQAFEMELEGYGKTKPLLPLKDAGHIKSGNAARMDWEEVCPKKEDDEIYLIGNPPYLGSRYQEGEHRDDMNAVLGHFKKYKRLDYITIWFYKGANYIRNANAKLAFVSTNSITQGEQVYPIWTNVLGNSLEIFFAYQSFKWTNNAKGNAGVTVVIIGLRNESNKKKYLYTKDTLKSAKNINGYLIDGVDTYIQKRRQPLSDVSKIGSGNRALDKGFLLLKEKEKDTLIRQYPEAKKLVKPVVGAAEFLQGRNKYCLWIYDEDLDLANSIPPIKERIESVREYRLKRKNTASKNPADFPHQFLKMKLAEESVLFLPTVSSERRKYIPCGLFDNETVIIDPNFAIYDPEPFIFGIISSRMHMVWVQNFGGKLKTDYRYS